MEKQEWIITKILLTNDVPIISQKLVCGTKEEAKKLLFGLIREEQENFSNSFVFGPKTLDNLTERNGKIWGINQFDDASWKTIFQMTSLDSLKYHKYVVRLMPTGIKEIEVDAKNKEEAKREAEIVAKNMGLTARWEVVDVTDGK